MPLLTADDYRGAITEFMRQDREGPVSSREMLDCLRDVDPDVRISLEGFRSVISGMRADGIVRQVGYGRNIKWELVDDLPVERPDTTRPSTTGE